MIKAENGTSQNAIYLSNEQERPKWKCMYVYRGQNQTIGNDIYYRVSGGKCILQHNIFFPIGSESLRLKNSSIMKQKKIEPDDDITL